MSKSALIVFVSIVTTVYVLINYYIGVRGWQALSINANWQKWFLWIFIPISSSYILARFLEAVWLNKFTIYVIWIGSFWLAAVLYFVLLIVVFDLSRLTFNIFHFHPAFIYQQYEKFKLFLFIGSCVLVFSAILYGYVNACKARIKNFTFEVNKIGNNIKELNAVVLSDIHLGSIIGKVRFDRIVNEINNLNPDIVLFAGDVVDENIAPIVKFNIGESLLRIKSKYGVYAITGNHEYIGGVDAAVKYLQEHGVKMLRDTALLIDSSFYLIGRDDKDKERFTGQQRKDLPSLIDNIDKSKPMILLDHQPFKLAIADSLGIDVQFSGHTHHGQMFPFQFITKKVFEVSWGYKKLNNMQVYVSSGVGSWGPPVRIGNTPEIINAKIIFK